MDIGDLFKKLENMLSSLGSDDEGEVEVNVVEIDGVEYSEVMRLPLDGSVYVYLSDLEDPENFMIRKLTEEDGETYLIGLDSREEFDKALIHFSKKVLGE